MDYLINPDNINQVPAGQYLAREGAKVLYVFLILKGKVAIECGSTCVMLGAGCYVGMNDVFVGQHTASYRVEEDASVYAFTIRNQASISNVLTAKKDYAGIAVWTMARTVYDYDRLRSELAMKAEGLTEYIRNRYEDYINISKKNGFIPMELKLVNQLRTFEAPQVTDKELLDYYLTFVKQPINKSKDFFDGAESMATRHLREEGLLIFELQQSCDECAKFTEEAAYLLMNRTSDNLYMRSVELVGKLSGMGRDTSEAEALLTSVKDTILEIVIFFEQNMHHTIKLDLERMEEAYMSVLENGALQNEKTEETAPQLDAEAVAIMRKSLEHGAAAITRFANWPFEKAEPFIANIEKFVSIGSRMSSDESLRMLKKDISKQFFELYKDVFFQTIGNVEIPQVVDLFLNYAFVDDRLLTDEQLGDLCQLRSDRPSAPCQVFTFREWLKLIYDGKRKPSRSEMDLDFDESLRDRKKRGELTDEAIEKLSKDPVQWVTYEVNNMFASNERLANGQVTSFVPILYKDNFGGIPSKMRMSKDRINVLVGKILSYDPSAFCRELIYNDSASKIEREPIIKQIYPEFVLLPINGGNINMWQDISGRKRDTAGRFMVPIFFEGNAEDAMIRAVARFRWELCKSIQSISWNNPQVKSLTSEYYDYIEFYKKNRDLSEERKEKIKTQLTKARNNLREVFVQDYENWIKFEANGAVRMNKVAREIFATYIPFSKSIRTRVADQPIFADAMARFERNLKKKLYDMELHYGNLEKAGAVITPELKFTKEYYNNL